MIFQQMKLGEQVFKAHLPTQQDSMGKWGRTGPFLARLLILIKKGLLQLKFGVVVVGVNIYLWAR